MPMLSGYEPGGGYDELLDTKLMPRAAALPLFEHLAQLDFGELHARQELAQLAIESSGISFTVDSEGTGIDRTWPFDIVPRIIDGREWDRIEAGLVQRLVALNRFIADVYAEQTCITEGVIPPELVLESRGYLPECRGATPAHGVWAHICGSDLVRDADGTVYVLEDNLRVPSGVSYMLENRLVTKRVFAELFADQSIRPIDAYPDRLLRILGSLAPDKDSPVIAVLTPGVHNAAYFEHSFLAREMGVHLVEGSDLFVHDDMVYAGTIEGPVQVDVLYRRVDDTFLDPRVFRPESVLGAPGLIGAWKAGNVAIANAPGTGVADDKAVYAFVPDLIRFYLDQEPILSNVPTMRCSVPDERREVLERIGELVVKPANESGGYGITVGPKASAEELAACAAGIEEDPAGWVAQPTISLSTVPTLCDGELAPRHVDLRPFTLLGADSYVTCGGLTRVARKEGSLIVNSSQGGGSKDTWVVDHPRDPRPGMVDLTELEQGALT